MAVIKAVKKPGKSAGRAIDYAAKDKDRGGVASGINCADDPKQAAQDFQITKETWDQTEGRQYKHYVQGFAPGEVTPEQAHEIGRQTAEKTFPGHEVYVGTHVGADGKTHNHLVVNSVNYEDGTKIHESKKDLENIKEISDGICRDRGLSVIDRDNRPAPERGTIITYDMRKHQAAQRGLAGDKTIRLTGVVEAVREAAATARTRQEFKDKMAERGYQTNWTDKQKHVTFTDKDGNKVRAQNLAKTFSDPTLNKSGIEQKIQENARSLEQRRDDRTAEQAAAAERQTDEPATPARQTAEREPVPEPEAAREVADPIRRHEMQGELDRAAREDAARRGDQRTADERRQGVQIDDEEAGRRAIGKQHDINKGEDRSNVSPIGHKPPPGQDRAAEQRQAEQQPPGRMNRDEARRNVRAAIADRAAEDKALREITEPKVAEARREVDAEAIKRDHPAAMRERAEAIAKREAAAAQERQQLNKEKPGWLSGDQVKREYERKQNAHANRVKELEKDKAQLEKDRRDPAQWDKDRLDKDPAARRQREATARQRAGDKDPTVKKALARQDQIPYEKTELGKIERRLDGLKGPTVGADLTPGGCEKAARNPEPVKHKLDQQKSQERENTRDTGRGR